MANYENSRPAETARVSVMPLLPLPVDSILIDLNSSAKLLKLLFVEESQETRNSPMLNHSLNEANHA